MHSWPQLTLLGFWLTEPCSDEFQAPTTWYLDPKWCHNSYELLMNDHGAQILQEWPPSTAQWIIWLFWPSLLHLQVTWLDDIFLYFWLVNRWKAMIYKCNTCLVINNHTHKATHPLGGKQRCTKILEAMIWYDMMPWGILGTKLGSYRCPYLRSF